MFGVATMLPPRGEREQQSDLLMLALVPRPATPYPAASSMASQSRSSVADTWHEWA